MRLATFKTDDLKWLITNKHIELYLSDEDLRLYGSQSKHAYTIFGEDGQVLLCGGVTDCWPGRGMAWAVLNLDCRHHFISIHNMAKRFFEACPIRRIEAAVEVGFEAGHRWVNALGFQLEAARLRSYFPDGRDASLYARVK